MKRTGLVVSIPLLILLIWWCFCLLEHSKMERRNFISQPQMSELGPDCTWNRQHSGPQINLDGSSMLPSHSIVSQSPSVVPHVNTATRLVDIPLPNFNSGSMNYMANGTKNSHGSYICPPSSSLSQLPPHYLQNGPCYNQVIVNDSTGMPNPQMEYGRATYKRKFPSVSDAERGSLGGHCGAGSSSSFPFQNGYLEPKPLVGHGYWPVVPASSMHSYRGNELLCSEDTSQRNVRSRHGNVLHLGSTSTGVHSSNYMPHYFPPVMNTINPPVPGPWNHNSVPLGHHAFGSSSGPFSFNYDMHHPNRGSYGPNVGIGNSRHNQPNAILGSTLCYPLPRPHDTTAQSSAVIHSSSSQRTAYRTPPSHPATGFTANSQDFRVSPGITPIPPRYSRNLSIVGHGNEGSRARNQFQILPNSGNAPARWAYEGAAFADQASFYNSMNYFDHHSDMRLDIDNMSYEELLSLGERIGSVNTGLTEEAMSRCLRETTYCSSNMMQDDQDKENCAICLELYEDREALGKLNCRHEFHAVCIKKWLTIKNACPICKVSALEDIPKDKHAISM